MVSSDQFKAALSRWVSGVAVITTRHPETKEPAGFTASSFSSVSLSPPLVLFCLGNDSTSRAAFEVTDAFAINLLAEDQRELSARFAQQGGDKFPGVAYREGLRGVPLLQGTLACLECRVTQVHPAGDHLIFVGEVEQVHHQESKPLVYFRGKYHQL